MATGVHVRLRNFEKYKGRGDVKHNSWFRCSNRLIEDSDFFEFSHAEILAWIYIMSLASQKNSGDVFVNFDHADRICRLKKRVVLSAIEKLEGIQVDTIADTSTIRPRYAGDTSTCATGQTGQDITDRQDITGHAELRLPSAHSAPSSFSDSVLVPYLKSVNKEVQSMWVSTYGDEAWTLSELKKAILWMKANPTKAPKSNYTRFFTNWLSRGWETYRKTLPSKAAGYGSKIEDILGAGA